MHTSFLRWRSVATVAGAVVVAVVAACGASHGGGDDPSRVERDGVAASRPQPSVADAPAQQRTSRGLSAEQLMRVVDEHRAQLRDCYFTLGEDGPVTEPVTHDVTIAVEPDGNVSDVRVAGDAPGFKSCIAQRIKAWVFPLAQEPTRTSFPLVFQPGPLVASNASLSVAALAAVFQAKRAELQRCYDAALRASASASGQRLLLSLRIEASGAVRRATVEGNPPLGMAACIEAQAMQWRFPAAQDATEVTAPLQLDR